MSKRILFLIVLALSLAVLSFAMKPPHYRSDEFNKAAVEAYDAIFVFKLHLTDFQANHREIEADNALTHLSNLSRNGIESNVSYILSNYFQAIKRFQREMPLIEQYSKDDQKKIVTKLADQNLEVYEIVHCFHCS